MIKKIQCSLPALFVGLVISLSVNANYLSDWSNEDLCRWMNADILPKNISDEIYERKLICYDDFEVGELPTASTYSNENGTVFPSPSSSNASKVKMDSAFTFKVNYKITL